MVDERGTVKQRGTIKDRRDAPWRLLFIGVFVIALLATAVVVFVGAILLSNVTDTARQAKRTADQAQLAIIRLDRQNLRIDSVAKGQCERVQVERERSNVAEATIFLVLDTASRTAPARRARRAYRDQADATAYSPPANCEKAVQDPRHYRLPDAIPFPDLPPNYAHRIIRAAKHRQAQPLPR